MSEEKITEIKEEKQCSCFLKSECFKNFLVTTLGTFVGVYLALSLFAVLHKPCMHRHHHKMMPPIEAQGQFRPHRDFKGMDKMHKEFRGDKIKGEDFKKPEQDD